MRGVTSLYVHLPFCRRKCHYCDFPVVAGAVSPLYLESLHTDMTDTRLRYPGSGPLHTLYFGGGTPTLLSESQLESMLTKVTALWPLAESAEVSIECDPGTLTPTKARLLKSSGITRVSVGAQTLDDGVLAAAGRSHTVRDFWETVDLLLSAGFDRDQLCVDLIVGLPTVTESMWAESVSKVVALRPGHMSTYFLTLEEHTPFHRKYTEYTSPLPTESALVDMSAYAHSYTASHGYSHYEISNYALPGKECRHSHVYWSGNTEFMAVGLGAASYTGGVRASRPRQLSAYYRWVQGEGREATPAETPIDRAKNRLMYQMRRRVGIDLEEYEHDFGPAVSQVIDATLSPLSDGHIAVKTGSCWQLTVPHGFLVSSSVLSDLFLALETVL